MLAQLYADHLKTVLARTATALHDAGFTQVAIHSGVPKIAFQDDYHYHFKPNFNFLHYVPLTQHPHSFVVIKAGQKPLLIFLQPRDYWHVVPSDPHGFWVEHFDIRIIRTPDEAKALIPAIHDTVFVGEDVGAFSAWGFQAFNPPTLLAPLHWQRAYKTAYEVECMALANLSASRAHTAAKKAFLNGASEYDIHLAYLRATELMEAELPYGNIVALNDHGAILHYTELQRQKPAHARSFLIDAGASVNGYAADITRTYSANDDDFAAMIHAMDQMEQHLISTITPGKPYLDVHLAAHLGVANILKQFDLVRDLSVEAIVAEGVSSVFYPHGVGHLLGLQVHDIGGRFLNNKGEPNPPPAAHPFLRLTRTIDVDMVFTIEPGLYFIAMLLDEFKTNAAYRHINLAAFNAFKPFGGIRIEDNVQVLAHGTRNLTRVAFAAL